MAKALRAEVLGQAVGLLERRSPGVSSSQQNELLKSCLRAVNYSAEKIELEIVYQTDPATANLHKNPKKRTSPADHDMPRHASSIEFAQRSDGLPGDSLSEDLIGSPTRKRLPAAKAARSANSKVRMTDNAGVMGALQTFTVSLPNTVKKYTRLQRRSRW